MDTLTFLERYTLADGRDYAMFTDGYHKLKICKFPEIYHITNIFAPYSNKNFLKIIDLSPNALVGLLSNGDAVLIELSSLETNEYQGTELNIPEKLEGKKLFDIVKIDSQHFLGIDDYYTIVGIFRLEGTKVTHQKIENISDQKVLGDVKEFYSKRSVEAYKVGDKVEVFLKFENKDLKDTSSPDIIKLHQSVYFRKVTLALN